MHLLDNKIFVTNDERCKHEKKSMTILWAVHMGHAGDEKNADMALGEKSEC